jgi:nucleoside phosphorylase
MTLRKIENLYLHYLDRELRDSVSCRVAEVDLLKALLASFCLTPGRLFCGYSHLWESYDLLADSLGLLRNVVGAGLVIPASGHRSSSEFLSSRQDRYIHDAGRYPVYFKPRKSAEIRQIEPGFSTISSATASLNRELLLLVGPTEKGPAASDAARRILEAGLKDRGEKAITGSLFAVHAGKDYGALSNIRRIISELYTGHYMEECNADILTSIPRLGLFDGLALSFPHYDYAVFSFLLGVCYGAPESPSELRLLIERAAEDHNSPDRTVFLMQFERLLRACFAFGDPGAVKRAPAVGGIMGELSRRTALACVRRMSKFSFEEFGNILLRLEKASPGPGPATASGGLAFGSVLATLRKKIVFLLATDSEWNAANEVVKARGLHLTALSVPKVAAWSVGEVNGYDLLVVRTEIGTQSAGAATLVTSDAIEVFRPAYVIMPGIAFGLKQGDQKMADILVAGSVIDYETSKIAGGTVVSRGASYSSSPELFAKAREVGAARGDVHYGEVISGVKLVNDPVFRDALSTRYPSAIGGEMEGIGLASACHRENIPWLLAKAICDWGAVKTDDHQAEAATKALGFCLDVVGVLPAG